METIIEKLKVQIIDQLNLTDVDPSSIWADAPLFGDEGLGLDSIDALELVVLIDKNYGIKVDNPASIKEAFHSLTTLATFIAANKPAAGSTVAELSNVA
jgi:acyl carrier protein